MGEGFWGSWGGGGGEVNGRVRRVRRKGLLWLARWVRVDCVLGFFEAVLFLIRLHFLCSVLFLSTRSTWPMANGGSVYQWKCFCGLARRFCLVGSVRWVSDFDLSLKVRTVK